MSSDPDPVGTKDPPVDGVLPASIDLSLAFNLESVVAAWRLGENEPIGGWPELDDE